MFRVKHAIVSLLAMSSIVVMAACSDDENAPPQVIFQGSTGNSPNKDCRDSNELFDVGSFGIPAENKPSVAVPTGSASGQGAADIVCSVQAAGPDTFNVSATLSVSGATGGLFSIEGQFKTSGAQTNIRVVASSRRSANSYEEKDRACVVTYDSPNMGVAAGRVWGNVVCPNAINQSDDNRACKITAQFRFENCTQ